MVASDTAAAPLAWPAAAGLLACVVAGAAAALEEAGLEVAGLEVVVLEPLEQAAISRPIPAAPMALAIRYLIVRLPLRTPLRECPRSTAPRPKPRPDGCAVLLLTTRRTRNRFRGRVARWTPAAAASQVG